LLLGSGISVAGTARGPAAARPGRSSALDLAAALFALQLATFLLQETLEAAVTGHALPSIVELVLWGSLGQLPVALLAALLLSWLGARLETAVVELAAATGQALAPRPALAPARAWTPARPALGPRPAAGAVSQRGPPRSLPSR
jgi:hypothetical protein